MDENASLGYWIKRQRKARDLTQDDLAERIGCATVTLRKIESDERRPSRQMAEKLADQFQLSAQERSTFLRAASADLCPDKLSNIPQPAQLAPPRRYTPPQATSSLPSGTLTFLFSEIVVEQGQWANPSPTLLAALTRAGEILSGAIACHQGICFQRSSTRIWAVFAAATDAVTAAIEAQEALYRNDWAALSRLRVRIALHTDSAQPYAQDYIGPTVQHTAALLAAAHPDQIVLSSATATLVRPALRADVLMRDLGLHHLSDLTSIERVFQLTVPELPADFPPLASLQERRSHLPAYATPLIGREKEVQSLCALLRHSSIRLVTLTGPGGSGKTRLAVQTGAHLTDSFSGGVTFVDLSPITDPALVPALIAEACKVPAWPGEAILATLRNALRHQEHLLLIDNCEHLPGVAALIADLISGAPRLTVLATSRMRLQLAGEHEIAVSPLPIPDLDALPPLSDLSNFAAIALFVQRAQALLPSFTLTDENASAVAAICAQLDGLPLGIELAAARSKLFSPRQLLSRLQRRLAVLTGGGQDLPLRQQTMRLAIDWSYNLLSAEEQALFRRVSVFSGGFTLEAMEAVYAETTVKDVPASSLVPPLTSDRALDVLASLIDHSLVQREAGDSSEPRFMLLETIREYALEQLETAGETATMHQRHATYYSALMSAHFRQWGTERPTDWVPLIAREYANIQAALHWTIAHQDGTTAIQLCTGAWIFWMLRGMWHEGMAWIEAALAGEGEPPPEALMWTLGGAGALAGLSCDYDRSDIYTQRALTLAGAHDDRESVAWLLHNLGTTAAHRGDFDQAKAYYEESLLVQQQLPRPFALTMSNLGNIALAEHDDEAALRYFVHALELALATGDQRVIVVALINQSFVHLTRHDLLSALPLIVDALRRCLVLGGHENLYPLLYQAADIISRAGDAVCGAKLLGAADGMPKGPISLCSANHSNMLTERIRAQLAPAAFSTVYAHGQRLSRMAAITLALDALERHTHKLPGERQ